MIPQLDKNGQLPPGVHRAAIDEVIARFGHGSDEREACGQSLQWLVPMCRRASIAAIFINGSFVTDCLEPQDVDCVLLPGGEFVKGSDAAFAIEAGLPYLSLQIIASDEERRYYLDYAFVTDRDGRPKGIVEVQL